MNNPKIDQLTSLFFGTSRLIRARMKPTKKTDPSTFLRIGTLHYISESKRPTMQKISKFLSITPPSVTSLINGLINSGMITRVPDTRDRRMIRIEISPKGRKFLEKTHKEMTERMSQVLEKLDPKDIDDLVRIMKKLQKAYEKNS
ncbi:MAG: hypothetical protein COV07_02270 [Candidatus Vogelbacteria bacterium CG10_big_fil_rev_8_21_14_0_10_45_14]|uniref:HTH marR-type domain-containing protein n=1 Tax=Candidatus Vogelbacteria bacterium CG10_big_fil_rev_8_21_14_0_10_45_14 TaxID=1975042 RepID=A0A2H0RJW4_9BACT|nr:MAG: hypothetical protein COV07_02270 [Candidatus Vogelbacteria bacterium CG10_big_fil_rev_8_21_14_0_10_45_14]